MSRPSIVEFAPIRAGRSLAEALRDRFELPDGEPGLKGLVAAYERDLILHALTATGWHQRRAAARLGVLPTTLGEKIKRHGIGLERTRITLAGAERVDGPVWRGRLPPGGTLEVRGLRGRVRVDASGSQLVEVKAVRNGAPASRPCVGLRVVEHRHGVSVCAVRAGASPCQAGLDEGSDDEAIDLFVRVPAGIDVVASASRGDVEIVGVSGNVEAEATHGHVVFLPGVR